MLGRLLSGPLAILYLGVGAWGFILVSQYIYLHWGYVGAFVSLFIFPATYAFVPLYAGIIDGYWLPAQVCYAPFVFMLVLSSFESLFKRR